MLKTKDLAVSRLAQIWCRRAGFGAVLERDISLHPPPPSAGLGAGAIGASLQAKQAQHVRASLVRCLACQVDIEATSNFRDPHPSALKLDRPSEVLKFDPGTSPTYRAQCWCSGSFLRVTVDGQKCRCRLANRAALRRWRESVGVHDHQSLGTSSQHRGMSSSCAHHCSQAQKAAAIC